MTSVYLMKSSLDLLEGAAFGGVKKRVSSRLKKAASSSSGSSSSSSSSSTSNKNSGSHLSAVETQNMLGGGVSRVDKDYPYSSYNISHGTGTRRAPEAEYENLNVSKTDVACGAVGVAVGGAAAAASMGGGGTLGFGTALACTHVVNSLSDKD